MKTISEVAQLIDLDKIIPYLEATTEESWLTETCRSDDGSQHCCMSHIWNYGGGAEDLVDGHSACAGSLAWDWFEEFIATVYMIFPVNDGEHPDYQQPTPKQRVIAYLRAIQSGHEMTTSQLMERDSARCSA